MNRLGIYIHIPFCAGKCPYCSFFSQKVTPLIQEKYFNRLIAEIKSYAPELNAYEVTSIYFGGGTPSLVTPDKIVSLLEACCTFLNISPRAEITLEANPESLTGKKLTEYKKAGINRISLGLQSCRDKLLQKIGRRYKFRDFLDKYKLVRQAGFSNIGIDLIFGIPGQTLSQWQETLSKTIKLNPAHISCYSLDLDNDSVWGKLHKQHKLSAADDQLDRNMYHLAQKMLKHSGYRQYEISNFAKPGFRCRHNLSFWNSEEFIGFGSSAHSFFKSTRFANTADIKNYIVTAKHQLNPKEQISSYVRLRLRLTEGLNINRFSIRFKQDIYRIYSKEIEYLSKCGLIKTANDRIRLTPKGMDLENRVAIEFI